MSSVYRTSCVDCRRAIEVGITNDRIAWPADTNVVAGGYVCMGCAQKKQAADDARRWEEARRRRETPAEKCLREARA